MGVTTKYGLWILLFKMRNVNAQLWFVVWMEL